MQPQCRSHHIIQGFILKYLIFIFITVISLNAFGLSAPQPNNRITVAVSPSLPPYVFSHDDTGLQLEIIKSAFKSQGVTDLDIIYMTNKRIEYSLEQLEVDVAVNYAGTRVNGIYPSQNLLFYQNVAVSLAVNDFKINSVYDLLGKSVLAFQNATAFISPPYETITAKLNHYEEVANQEAQVDHLMKEWVDVVVLEKRIFLYYLQQYQKSHEVKKVTIHPVFAKSPRPAYFNNKVLQEKFDMGLTHIIQSGEYHAIMEFDGSDYAKITKPNLIK